MYAKQARKIKYQTNNYRGHSYESRNGNDFHITMADNAKYQAPTKW